MSSEPYKIDHSGSTVTAFHRLVTEARQRGIEHEVAAATRTIIERLRLEPNVFGEPIGHLRVSQASLRVGVVRPVAVSYAVVEELHTVVIQWFRLLGD